MTSYLWAISASSMAVLCEIIFRFSPTIWKAIPYSVIPMILIHFFIYKLIRSMDTYLAVAIIFPFCTLTLRIISSQFVFHEQLETKMIIALGLMVVAQLVRVTV